MPLITDLNERERKSFAAKAENLAVAAERLARALRAGDDTEALVYLTLLALSGTIVNDLTDVFHKAVGTEVPDHPGALIPPIGATPTNDGKEN